MPIEGLPPDLIAPPPGCPFEPRCQYRRDICHEQEPDLKHIPNAKPDHEARCWGTQAWRLARRHRLAPRDRRHARLEAIKQETASVTSARRGDGNATTERDAMTVTTPPKDEFIQRSRSPPTATAATTCSVTALKMHFPLTQGIIFQRQVGAVRAVDGIDFSVKKGETLGLVGESGCGKSTTGRAILQLYKPTAGSVNFDGTDLTTLGGEQMRRMRRQMQMIFQDPYASLNPRMTVGNIIGEPLEIHNLAKGRAKTERVQELLQHRRSQPVLREPLPARVLGRPAPAHRHRPRARRRAGLHRCDEPISALDVSIQAQVINLLEELQEQFRLTYLFIAHDLSVVRHISDRVAVMYLGKIVELADRNDLYEHPLHPYTKALLSAVPIPDPAVEQKRKRIILTGDVPRPVNPPSGCRFHTRCWKAQQICSEVDPEFIEHAPRHWAACHFPGA